MSRFLPKFPIWWQDWLASWRIQAMTAEQEGGFLRLCLFQWQNGHLPNDDRALLRMARINGEPEAHRILLDSFVLGEDGNRRNSKVAGVLAEAEAWCDEQSRKSALGVAARRSRGQPAGQPTGNPEVNPRSTPPTLTLTQKQTQKQTQKKKPTPTPPKGGDPSPPTPSRQVTDHWCAAFQASRGSAYVFQRAKDGKAVKDALEAAGGDPAEVCRRIDRAFAHEFWGPKMSGLALFVSRWNDLTESPAEVAARQAAESDATRRRSEAKAKAEKVRSLLPLMEARTPEGLDLIESFRVGGRSQSDAEVVASLKQQIEKAAAL